MQLRKQFDLGRRHASHQVLGRQLRRVIEPGGGEHFGQSVQRVAVEVEYPLGLVRHHQGTLTQWVLRRHAGRAFVGVA